MGKVKQSLLVALVALSLAGDASAATTVRPPSDTSLPYAEWISEALVPTPDARLWIWRDDCPYTPGYNCTDGRTIWLHPLEHNLHETFLHELGHDFDIWEMRRADREEFRRIEGIEGRWRADELDEVFADAYRDCALGTSGPACDLINYTAREEDDDGEA